MTETYPLTQAERDLLIDRLRHCLTYLTESRRALNEALRLVETKEEDDADA